MRNKPVKSKCKACGDETWEWPEDANDSLCLDCFAVKYFDKPEATDTESERGE